MPSIFEGLQFKVTAAALVALVLLAALNEFLRTPLPLPSLGATAINLAATLVTFLLLFWYIRRQTQPLEELTGIARQIANGELAARADANLQSKIGEIAETFNQMADRLTQKIQLLQRDNQIKKEFISVMAHNLQTPLTVVLGYISQLREEAKLADSQTAILKGMEDTIKDLGEMNERLLTTIELQGEVVKINPTKQDLGPLASQVVQELKERAAEKQIHLELEVAREPLIAKFDEEWLKVVFENLLDNALKFTPEKGRVTVRVGKTAENKIFGEVEDTGIGIPKDAQEKVLLPFHHLGSGGLGIGLYIVRLVVEKHSGHLELESQEGEGTKIRFTLPAPEEK